MPTLSHRFLSDNPTPEEVHDSCGHAPGVCGSCLAELNDHYDALDAVRAEFDLNAWGEATECEAVSPSEEDARYAMAE